MHVYSEKIMPVLQDSCAIFHLIKKKQASCYARFGYQTREEGIVKEPYFKQKSSGFELYELAKRAGPVGFLLGQQFGIRQFLPCGNKEDQNVNR